MIEGAGVPPSGAPFIVAAEASTVACCTAQTALTIRDSVLAKLLFAGGHKSGPGCSASSASNDGSYRTADESAAHYPHTTTHSGTPGSSVSRRRGATQRSVVRATTATKVIILIGLLLREAPY